MSTISPNMGLTISTIAVDTGLAWEQNLNTSLSVIDGHNHSVGSGVQINPSGLNINTDLPFVNNNATNLRSVRFTSQSMPLSGSLDLGCLYVSGVDLYYNDEAGNKIQITSLGALNVTSSGISSGTASAAFNISNELIVNSATNTPANVQMASVILGNNVANTNYLKLSPPTLGTGGSITETVTLPAAPSQHSYAIIDSSGTMSTYPTGYVQNDGSSGSSYTIDFSLTPCQTLNISAATVTVTIAATGVNGESYMLILNEGVSNPTITWAVAAGTLKWPNGVSVTTSVSGKTDLVNFFYDGTNNIWYGTYTTEF